MLAADVSIVVPILSAVAAAALTFGGVLLVRRRRAAAAAAGPGRILFPFVGHSLSSPALDATLRLARVEGATLVPAYLARPARSST